MRVPTNADRGPVESTPTRCRNRVRSTSNSHKCWTRTSGADKRSTASPQSPQGGPLRSRHGRRLPFWLAGVAVILCACTGGTPSGNPDPGNHLLNRMAADPVLAGRPPASSHLRSDASPAHYATPAFEPSGWVWPAVNVTFTSTAPVLDVYEYYARKAQSAGWTVWHTGYLHVPNRWRKAIPGCGEIILSLVDLGYLPRRSYIVTVGVRSMASPATGC